MITVLCRPMKVLDNSCTPRSRNVTLDDSRCSPTHRCTRRFSLSLPGGEKGSLAVEGLSEGVAQLHHPSLPTASTPLHHHPRHLHQLDGALPVLQRLGQVQDLEEKGSGDRREDKGQRAKVRGRGSKECIHPYFLFILFF